MFTKLVPTEHLSYYTPFDGHFLLGFGTPWVKILELFPYTETVRLDDSLREAEKCCQENVQWTPSMPGPQSSPHLRSWISVGDPNMRESPASPGKLSGLLTLSSQTLGGNFPFLFPLLLGQRKWQSMPATIQVSQFKPGRHSTVLQVGTPWINCFQLKYSCVCPWQILRHIPRRCYCFTGLSFRGGFLSAGILLASSIGQHQAHSWC